MDAPHSGTREDLVETTGTALALVGAMLLAASLTRGPCSRWSPRAA